MQFSDLEFEDRENISFGYSKRARVDFPNGYGASVISGLFAATDSDHPHELAVTKDGQLCYDTAITDDVIGYQTSEQITALLAAIESLPCDSTP